MVRPALRSRSKRRVFRITPGGRNSLQFKRRKPSAAKCGACGSKLLGVPRDIPNKIKNMPKTHKRPERPFGGVLCSGCMRKQIISQARK